MKLQTMNKLFFILLFTFAASAMQSYAQDNTTADTETQEHNTAATDSCRTYYMEIKGSVNPTSGALMVSMDIGKMLTTRVGIPSSLLNAVAKEMRFGSMADAMNFLAQYRWKLVDTYTITTRGQTAVYWVVCKEAKTPVELLEGFGTPAQTSSKD